MAAKRGKQAVRNGGFPAWALVLVGLIAGAVGTVMVMRAGWMPITRQHQGPQANPQATAAPASEPGAADQAAAASRKPDYSFYSVLPEKEVVIPDAEISAQAKAEARQPGGAAGAAGKAAATSAGSGYLLQVGSFPSASDADAMKAKLALQGFRANIQPVSINGQTWNRVRLGPFASAGDLEAVKQRLSAAGIHAIALKETK